MAANLHFQVDLQDHRTTARKTKTVFQRALHGRRLDDTLPAVAVFGARSRKERAFFLAERLRSFRALHLVAKELPDAVNGEQTFSANLAAPSKANASNFAVSEKLIGKASLDPPTCFQPRNIDKLRIDM